MMLRRLTKFSRIDFGYYRGKTVQQILDCTDGKSYMVWLYFYASHIDLNQELLNELDIKHLILKPGTAPEIHKELYYNRDTVPHFIKRKDFGYKPGLLSMIPLKTKTISKSTMARNNRRNTLNNRPPKPI